MASSTSIYTEHWLKNQVQEKIASANNFLQYSKDHTPFVNNTRVHIPQAASPSSISVDNSSFPLSVNTRSDSDNYYDIHKFSSDAMQVEDMEAVELSYDLKDSILSQDINEIRDIINDYMLYYWAEDAASGSSLVETSSITFDDMLSLAEKFDEDNISRMGRKFIVNPSMAHSLYKIDRFEKTNDLNNNISIDGYVGRLAGFDIFVRDTVLEASGSTGSSALTIIPPSVATGVTEYDVGLAWHPDYVSRAFGDVKLFMTDNHPLYQGTLLSFAVRAGGNKMRSDGKGVYGLVDIS
jgi:hypothetical protein